MTEPADVDLWALSDLCTPWCLHVVATLRIADCIADGATLIDDLARESGADSDSLYRVLLHLVGKGVFEETEPGRFALNQAAEMLRDDHPSHVRFGLDLDGFGNRMAYAWGSLLSAVRTGKPAYQEIFGRPFWEDLDAHPDIAASFDAMMGPSGHDTPDPDVLITPGWEAVRIVVDVGGGTGTLLAEILRARPGIRGILVDLPRTVTQSDETFRAAGVADRVTTVGQSFFDLLPAGGDLYVLKNLLADWPDPEAKDILRRCAEAARPAGRVVILGGISPDGEGSAPSPALLMMVLVGGRERTLTEFRELAGEAGLEVGAAGRQPSGRFVVECHPNRAP
jgi:2,7-dihydroxy-5-methyl-1-naphthoate 7-O-methyltransferase